MDYNLNLSEERAQTAVAFLMQLNIAPERLTAIGYGESQLLNRCSDAVNCSDQEHALNRRTEIRLVFN